MGNLSDNTSIDNSHLLEDSGKSMAGDSSSPVSNAIESKTWSSFTFEDSRASIPLESRREGVEQKQINLSDQLPNPQSAVFSLDRGPGSRQIALLSHLDGEASLANVSVSPPSRPVMAPDANSRRSQLSQKATPNNR